MSILGSRENAESDNVQDPLKSIEKLLGEESAKNIINKLNTSNGGDIALTLREIERNFTKEHLIDFVNNYARLEYRKAKRDLQSHSKEELRKDLLSARIVIGEYQKLHSGEDLDREAVQNIKNMINKVS